jgi:hypothetical protein
MRSIGEMVRMTDSPLNLGREGMLVRITEVLPNYLRNQPVLQQYVVEFLEEPGGRKETVAELQIEDVPAER